MTTLLERAAAFADADANDQPIDLALAELRDLTEGLRTVYRALAADPAGADEAATLLAELHAQRRVLADRVAGHLLREARDRAPDVPPPEPSEERAVEAAPRPATQDAIEAFSSTFVTRGALAAEPSPAVLLHELLEIAGPPAAPASEAEIDRLEAAVTDKTMGTLLRLEKETQRAFLAMVTARIAAARAAGDGRVRERMYALLATIREFSMRERPGSILGLKRDHEPRFGSWTADAEHLWRRLGGDPPPLESAGRPSIARPKRQGSPQESSPVGPDERSPPLEWPLWSRVRDATALMVGGEPREASRVRIERMFHLRELLWIPDEPRKIDNAVARIETHGFDLVLVLSRFVSHPSSERLVGACSSAGIIWAHVERGYGAEQIRLALERFAGARSASRGEIAGSR